MTSDLRIQGEVVVNSEKAESAFNRVGDKATQMANEVATSAGKAGQAVDKIGDGAGASAEKFTRAESRISASIKRATNELELLGKTASQRLEFNIADKGLDAAKFEPALKKLRELEAQAQAAQRAASGSLDGMGMSAKQTAAALRQVPMQFTDIIVSLQGGQSAMQVFLQQGGQLKDMFGGAGAAARALGGYVLGLVNPFTVLAAAAAGVALSYNQGSKEADAYRMALITTGNAAGTTAGQLQAYARDISGVVGTQGKAAESLAAMAGTGKVVGDMLRESAQAAVMWERATGQAVGKTAEQFASFAGAPLQSVLKMNDSMNFLTLSTYKQIKALEDEGRTTEAAAAAQRAYADALSGRAGEIERNLGSIERGWNRIKDAAKAGWDAILNVGRQNTTQDQLSDTRKRIAQLESQLGGGFGDTGGGAATGRPNGAAQARIQAELAGLKAQEAALQGVAYASKVAAEEEAARAAQVKAAADWDKEGLKYLSDRAKMERELVKARNEGAAAGASQAEIEQRLAAIRESYAKKGGGSSGIAAENKELRDQRRIYAELADVSSTYYADLEKAQQQRAKGNLSEAQYVKYVEDLIQKQPFAVALVKAETEARKEFLQIAEQERQQRLKIAQAAEQSVDSLATGNQKLRDEIQLIGLSATEQMEVLRLREESVLLVKEQHLAEMKRAEDMTGTMTRERIALEQEIDARRELLGLIGSKEAREANKKAADDAAKDWERTAQTISDTLADYIMSGGKDAAQYLKRLFATLVLQPTVQMLVGSVLGTGPAAAASTGSSIMGLAGNANSLAGMNTGWLTNFGATLPGSIASTGAQIYSQGFETMGNGLMDFGNSIAGYADALNVAGDVLGYGSAIFAAANGKWGQAIGSAVGTYFGGPIGSFIGSTIGKWADKIFSGGAGTPHTGGAGSYSAAGGQATGLAVLDQGLTFGVGERYYNSDAEKAAVGISQGIVQMLDSTAQSFGQQAGYFAATAFADDSSKDGAWGSLRIMRGDEKVLDWADTQTSKWAPKEFSDGEAGQKEYAAAIAASARDALKTALGDADWAKDMLDTLGDSVTLEGLDTVVAQINQAKAAFTSFGQYMPTFAGLAQSAVSAMVDAAGGVGPLSQGMATFVENFYSEAEKAANVTRDVTAALADVGLQMPTTREGFRALVEQQMALGESGAQAVAALLGVSGAFASVTAASETAAEAAARLADEQAKAAKEAQDAYQKQARAAQEAADAARRAQEDLLEALTKAAEQALKILGNAIDAEKKVQQAEYDAQMVIIDAQRKASTTFVEAQRAWLNVAIDSTKNYAKALESEAARIRGFFTGMVLQDNPDAPAGASVFAAQAALRAGDKSDAVLRKATDIDPEMFASWADYAVNFFETQGLVRGATQDAERAASVAASDVALLEQQLTLAEDKYKADLEHYTKLEGIAKETLDSNLLRLDALVQSAQDQLAEATGTKLAVMTIAQAMGNFSGAVGKLAQFSGNTITTPLPTAPVLTPFGAQTPEPTIAPVAYSPVVLGGSGTAASNDKVVAALRDVVAELQALRSTGADTKAAVEKTAALIDQVTAGGNAMLTETA